MSHISIEAAAPAPAIPTYSPSRRLASEPSSRSASRGHVASPLHPRHRNPNDARIVAPTTDVINDLLASFPDISYQKTLQPSSGFASPISKTPVYRSRNPSQAPTPRFSASPQRALSSQTHDFYEYPHPIQDTASLPPEEDAAEPPVIRTSRPPSAVTKAESKRATPKLKPRSVASPRPLLSPPPELATVNGRAIPPAPPTPPPPPSVPESKAYRSGYSSPSILKAARKDSLDSMRGPDTIQNRFLRLTSRSKNRDVYSPSRSSLRAAANDFQRAGMSPAAVHSPVNRSIPSSSRRSLEKPPNPLADEPSPTIRTAPTVNGYAEHHYNLSANIPPTMDTTTAASASQISLAALKDESQIPATEDPSIKPTNALDPESNLVLNSSPLENVYDEPNEDLDSHETDVMRRIRELKAAKEERRKSQEQNQSSLPNHFKQSAIIENDSAVLVPGPRPNTATASEPLIDRTKIEGQYPSNWDGSTYETKLAPAIGDTANARPTPSPALAGSPILRGVPLANSIPKNSPELSHSNSRRKRWSPLTVPATQPSSPKPDHRRNRNSISRQPAATESHHPSMDVINASVRDFLAAPRLSQKIKFPADGRNIAFSEVGDPNGSVVICCVGMGLTRYIMAYYDELATSLKLRLITPDRPGIGDSEPYQGNSTSPFDWPDDIKAICAKLGISKFSLLAHSAGTIYALATALRMPDLVRGKIHLLAPWIPQSQLTDSNSASNAEISPGATLTKSQRFLRILPTSLLKLSNSSLAGINNRTNSSKSSSARGRKSSETAIRPATVSNNAPPRAATRPPSPRLEDVMQLHPPLPGQDMTTAVLSAGESPADAERERQRLFDEALTPAIWEMATRNGNPAIDLLVCLERNRPIGFRYADVGSKPAGPSITAKSDIFGLQWPGYGFVIHHGSRDTRVPVENVKWLGRHMRNSQVRVLEGQGHGLMAAAGVMSGVLTEIGKDWEAHVW